MQRTFLSNLFILILLNVLVKPLWVLGIDVEVQNTLGPEVYGNYFALVNFAFLFTVMLDFGINNYTNRKISRNPSIISQILVESALVKMLLAILFAGILFSSAIFMNYSVEEMILLKYICVMLFLQSFLIFLRSNLSGIQWYRADVLMSVLDKSLMIVIVAAMIWGSFLEGTFQIHHFIMGQCIAYLIAILVACGLLMSRVKSVSLSLSFSRILLILKESAPYALLTFLMLVYFKVDAVMIERLLVNGNVETGYYAQAYKLLEAAVMFTFLFSSLLLPMFSRMIAANERVNDLVHLSSRIMLVPSFILVVIMVLYGADFMNLMYDSGATESAEVFPILMTTLLPLGANYIFGTLITAEGDLKFLNKISLFAIILNILMNWILIPVIGIMGAAISTLITQFFVAIVQWYMASKKHALNYSTKDFMRAFGFMSLTLMGAWGIKLLELDWILSVFLIGTIGLSIAFFLRLFSKSYFKEILSYQK